jgi:hypothetical protein
VAARSDAWTVFARSNAGTLGSNPTQGMDVCECLYSVFLLSCVKVAASRRADHSSKESYSLYKNDYEAEEEARAHQRAIEPLMNEWMNERTNEHWYPSSVHSTLKTHNCVLLFTVLQWNGWWDADGDFQHKHEYKIWIELILSVQVNAGTNVCIKLIYYVIG